MPTHFSPRVASMQPSATLAMSSRAKELARAGHSIIALSAGEPDFATPAPIAQEGINAIRQGFTRYTQNPGMPELREAICRKLLQDNALSYEPNQILCSNGAKQSVALAVAVLAAEGDEVLIPAPYWVSYPEMVRFAGARPVILPTTAQTSYRISPKALEQAITDKTRLLIMCSPSNPTGSVYTREELAAIASVVSKHENLYVISDEIYEHIVYDTLHTAFAELPGMQNRTITVNGFSKCYAMTGWRLGYMAGPTAIVKQAAKVQGQFTSAPCSITQRAGIAALGMEFRHVATMVTAFRKRRDYVLAYLGAIPGIHCPMPQGAFYAFPEMSEYFGRSTPSGRVVRNSNDLCFYLLEEHGVAMVPGAAFGGPNGVRLSYAASDEDLAAALQRLETGLAQLG